MRDALAVLKLESCRTEAGSTTFAECVNGAERERREPWRTERLVVRDFLSTQGKESWESRPL